MGALNQNLEYLVEGSRKNNFKSEGERRIAYFLDTNLIKYKYEPAILVNSNENKSRIWYPDYFLPEFGTYIEYYGLAGKLKYDMGIRTKESVYSKMGLDVVPIYSWMFSGDWQSYLMKEIERTTKRRSRSLKIKQYLANKRLSSYQKFSSVRQACRKGLNKRY